MDEARRFCDDLCEELFESIDAAATLEAAEKRVLAGLWRDCTVRTQCVEHYAGDIPFAKHVKLSVTRTKDTLEGLARKGFIKPIADEGGAVKRIRLNALMLEAAYDAAKRSRIERRDRPDAA